MKILHICAGWEGWNGAANIARKIMGEQRRAGHEVAAATWASVRELRAADEVWIHCGWLPCLWWAAANFSIFRLIDFSIGRKREKVLKWMPECCYDPVRLGYHGWKKRLAGPIERFCLRRCTKIVATCEAEKGWIEAYLGKKCPSVEVTDIKRFFDLKYENDEPRNTLNTRKRNGDKSFHLLYLGRRHPLKGLEYLEEAVRQVNSKATSVPSVCSVVELKIVSNAFGEELERVWDWCDVLVLPTLSDNFGLVVAEALERGKGVITTDGAPAWGEGNDYGGRLMYLKGYRDGTPESRVRMLREAIERLASA